MDDEKAILKEIANNLDDDTPRLILADWYSERGDPRGDFIRTQCDLARIDWDDPRYEELASIEESLHVSNRVSWLKKLPKLNGVAWGCQNLACSRTLWWRRRSYFRRGFAELATFKDFSAYRTNAKSIDKYGFITHANFLQMSPKAMEVLANYPKLRGTSFFQCELDTETLGRFAAREKLELLAINECWLANSASQLMDVDFPSLRVLDLTFNSLKSSASNLMYWDTLARVQWLGLGLSDNEIRRLSYVDETDVDLFRRLADVPFQNLHALKLSSCQLFSRHITEIALSRNLTRLTELGLSKNHLTDNSIVAISKGCFPNLRHLDLASNDLHDNGAIAIATAPAFRSLHRLNLADNSIHNKGIEAIAQSEHLSNLTHLNISSLDIGEPAIDALIRSQTLNKLRYLKIRGVRISVRSLETLMRRYPNAVVRKLYD